MESAAPNMIGPNATSAAVLAHVIVAASNATVAASNATVAASNATETTQSKTSQEDPVFSTIVMLLFSCGILLNTLALCALNRRRSSSNQKHGFMLRCMIYNDIIALVGMFTVKAVKLTWQIVRHNVWCCRVYVLLRFFGLGSGCVATIMAIERWLALTKPFFYQKHISLRLLKRSLISLSLITLCLVCAPFIGIGQYWDAKTLECIRYRDVNNSCDVMYAYAYFSFGLFLCVVIVASNLAVMKALCIKNGIYNKQNVLMRRVSRGSSLTCNAATKEERSFGRLMLFLCISFVMCWIPQLVLVPLAIHTPVLKNSSQEVLSKLCNLFLAVHFILDPCFYVLHHWTLVKSVFPQRWSAVRANGGGSASVSRSSSMRTCTYEVYSQQP